MVMSKKAVEEPRVIVYVLFTTILVLSGLYIAFTYMGVIDLRFDFSDYNFRYNSAASRIMNSPSCYAYQEAYTKDGQTYYQVLPGVIDLSEIKTQLILDTCIRGEKQIFINITQYDPASEESMNNYILYTGSSQPSSKDLSDADKWKQKELAFKVLLRDGANEYNGVMRLRLKE